MKRILTLCTLHFALCIYIMAVPAQSTPFSAHLADGSTITARLVGDEFEHYYLAEDGRHLHLGADGLYYEIDPTTAAPRRAAANERRQKANTRRVGSVNLAPRGLIIIVNFSDVSCNAATTTTSMNEFANGSDYTFNGATGSCKKYFQDQSNGTYNPQFDVYGPITLSHNMAYYGQNVTDDGDDYVYNMIIDACTYLDTRLGVDFTQYDSDNDGEIDFVYVIYAGYGENYNGADENTIWPHNYWIKDGWGVTKKYDNKYLNNYACSAELEGTYGTTRCGIGTFCHEFGHVLGLPDFYDTNYGTNYEDGKTPGDWDVMDSGSYNNSGKTPPNYSPWEKAFMGWLTPVNPGNTGADLTLYANGTSQYVAYQINQSGTYQDATTPGVCYYIENRQKTGWDAYVPGHGMLIWKVNYNQTIWEENTPNNTAGNCRYTVVSASGNTTGIGKASDPFPGTGRKTSWSGISTKPITDIQESNQIVSCKYMGGAPACTGYSVSFVSTCATMTADAGFDADCVVAGMDFEGSFQMKNGYVYDSVVVTMGGRVLSEEEVEYIADATGIIVSDIQGDVIITLYGHKEGNSSFSQCEAYSWTASKALSDGSNTLADWSWTLAMTGSTYKGYDSNNTPSKGAQFGSGNNPASQVSLTTSETADCMIDQIKVNASIGSKGTGQLAVYIDGTQVGQTMALSTTATEYTFSNTDELQGSLEVRYTNTAKALYLKSINVSFVAPTPTEVQSAEGIVHSAKCIVNGQLLITVGDKTYNVMGQVVNL